MRSTQLGVYFDNLALYFECRIKKNTPSDCFLTIFPTGKYSKGNFFDKEPQL